MIALSTCKHVVNLVLCSVFLGEIAFGQATATISGDCPTIERRLPPLGNPAPPQRLQQWQRSIEALQSQLRAIPASNRKHEADIQVLVKACEFAIAHQEFYRDRDFDKVDRLLTLAGKRLSELKGGDAGDFKPSWTQSSGLQVRGFRSRVDGSVQPVGLVFPENDGDQSGNSQAKRPLYVWLHGRGDKTTDLHFLCERLDKQGQIAPEGAVVLHPFGRQCVGYKSAGETDVMEAIDFVCSRYPIDEQRIVLMGFSMGGAGVWHLAAHYGERFVAASPGAGFAETARYQRLTPDKYPSKYEQILWQVYDVPSYVRNLFNFPVIAYSGENDKQIQAARVMEEAFEEQGRKLPHLIGPGMGHKYHPDTLSELLTRMHEFAERGQATEPTSFYIQSPHPRYAAREWLTIDGAQQQYADTRADAQWTGQDWKVTTLNVSRLTIDLSKANTPRGKLVVDGQDVKFNADDSNAADSNAADSAAASTLFLKNEAGKWAIVDSFSPLRKHPGVSGPIDDAFIDSFLVVIPSLQNDASSKVDQWVACELEFFKRRWRALMRGEVRIKRDSDVTEEDIRQHHLILWGTPDSNQLVRSLIDRSKSPIRWTSEEIQVGEHTFDATTHVPMGIYPNPANLDRYVVLNSGLTFRPAHDRTNSLQNPHLPDWAIIALDESPSAERPGRVAKAGFFDDRWQLDPKLTW